MLGHALNKEGDVRVVEENGAAAAINRKRSSPSPGLWALTKRQRGPVIGMPGPLVDQQERPPGQAPPSELEPPSLEKENDLLSRRSSLLFCRKTSLLKSD